MIEITPLKGVISVRGEMVPMMVLWLRLDNESIPYNNRNCIIVVRLDNHPFGLIVDDVEMIPEEKISLLFNRIQNKANYLTGIAQVEHVTLILNIDYITDYIFSEKEIREILKM